MERLSLHLSEFILNEQTYSEARWGSLRHCLWHTKSWFPVCLSTPFQKWGKSKSVKEGLTSFLGELRKTSWKNGPLSPFPLNVNNTVSSLYFQVVCLKIPNIQCKLSENQNKYKYHQPKGSMKCWWMLHCGNHLTVLPTEKINFSFVTTVSTSSSHDNVVLWGWRGFFNSGVSKILLWNIYTLLY